jgi:hypothetical protein
MLDCMAAPGLPKPTPAKRSVFLYIPNGVNTLTWQIEQAGAEYEFSTAMKPLEKHRADITPFSGLHHPKSQAHHNCEKVWLTGARFRISVFPRAVMHCRITTVIRSSSGVSPRPTLFSSSN